MTSALHGWFETSIFQARYQRNNKRGGLKNLRCFPTCAAQHKERGFCGRPVSMTVQTANPDRYLCWAEFLKSDDAKPLTLGSTFSVKEAESISRSKEEPLKRWIRGSFVKMARADEAIFEFNREKRGWHYGWASNKHTCNASHVLVAWIFERSIEDSNVLIVRGLVESPSFMLFCRRRRRFTLQPSAPISQPKRATSRGFVEEGEEEEDDEEEEEEEDLDMSRKRVSVPVDTSVKRNRQDDILEKNMVPYSASSASAASAKTSIQLDKSRVDALLSLLHTVWRRLKDSSGEQEHAKLKSCDSAHMIGSQEHGMIEMLEFLSGTLDFEHMDGEIHDVGVLETRHVEEHDEENDCFEELDPEVEALARYLMEEPDFRQSVQWLRGQGAHPDFNAFLGILRDHIQNYMQFRFWTVADIDRLIQASQPSRIPEVGGIKSESSAGWLLEEDALAWDKSSELHPASPRTLFVDMYSIPNISGSWRQTRESQQAMERVREQSGSSWVMSKLFEFMESKFTIHQRGLELTCRLWPMPALKFVLDGEEHPWGIRLPLFQPNWKYRAWTDGRVITLQHQIENRRLTRTYWCDRERKKLYSLATLEVFDAFSSTFIEESRTWQTADRIG